MIDILILVIIAIGVVQGFISGMVRQVIGLAGLLLTVYLGITWAESVGEPVTSVLKLPEKYAGMTGFALVFIGISIVVGVVSRLIMSMVKALSLSGINRIAGGLFGGLKLFALIGVVLLLLKSFDIPPEELRAQSKLYRPIVRVAAAGWAYAGSQIQGIPEAPEVSSTGTDPT